MTASSVPVPEAPGGAKAGAASVPRHDSLTRLRLALIGWVVLYHLDLPLHVTATLPWLRPLLGVGYLGVDGFFLLSGFALWLGYGSRPLTNAAGVQRFLLRRIAKIWPLHALALLALAVIVGLAQAAGVTIRDPERFSAADFLLQLFLVNAWETSSRFAWNYPSWALSVEWAGYLAFSVVLLLLRRLRTAFLFILAAGAVAGLFTLGAQDARVGLNYTLHLGLVRFALEFSLGLALGRLATEGRLPRTVVLVVTLAVPLGLGSRWDALTVVGLAAVIVALWQRPTAAGPAGRPDLLLRLGEASFGIYLCWVFIETALVGVLRVVEPGAWGRVLLMMAGLAANLAAGWLAWRWVEVPAHRWILSRVEPRHPGLDTAARSVAR
jgi:peptidoglycan/LPS O-acetylase OafA/YrhL